MNHRSRRVRRFLHLSCALALSGPASAQVGTVRTQQKISPTTGGWVGTVIPGSFLGTALTSLGDLDGDGVRDLAVSAPDDSDGGAAQGAVWVLLLNADGTVKAQQKISETSGGFGGVLDPGDNFGSAVAGLGDLDGDGIGDLAVGAYFDSDGATTAGAVWILFLNANGTVKTQQKISETSGGFGGTLGPHHYFGFALSALGDLDNDGIQDLAVGAVLDDKGAVWILFLNANGTVKGQQKISSTEGGFGGALSSFNEFGSAVAGLGDLDGDGVEDLAVGADSDDQGGQNQGALWILFLNTNGTVKAWQKINETNGGFGGRLDPGDLFGISLSCLGDLDGTASSISW